MRVILRKRHRRREIGQLQLIVPESSYDSLHCVLDYGLRRQVTRSHADCEQLLDSFEGLSVHGHCDGQMVHLRLLGSGQVINATVLLQELLKKDKNTKTNFKSCQENITLFMFPILWQ